ncbi:MAG TPA: YggS family pyridoxal phosphate-dependent enzyme [Candidatus Aquicultor sp.]|jgi:hypothetical protein
MSITKNVLTVRKRIEEAAQKSGRSPETITLVAVTKNQPLSAVLEVVSAGVTDIGENRSQELIPKQAAAGKGINWHFIGHLQRNKVRYIIPYVYLIQSVDSRALAQEISMRAKAIGKTQDILLEVNTSEEPSKHGFAPRDIVSAAQDIEGLANIRVKGLMTMAPFTEDTAVLKSHFAKTKEIFDNLTSKQGEKLDMRYLSMGMTNDFEIAIEHGANMVRIGTALFTP